MANLAQTAPNFDDISSVSAYTLVQDKRQGKSYYVKGEKLNNEELMSKIGMAKQQPAQGLDAVKENAGVPTEFEKENTPGAGERVP